MAGLGISLFSHSTFLVVSGASKGLGRCMAVRFGERLSANSAMLLVARGEAQLEKTKAMVIEKNPALARRIKVAAVDLAKEDGAAMERMIQNALTDVGAKPSDFDQAMIIHNAASLGDVSKMVIEFDDVDKLRDYFDLNLSSMLVINSVFLRIFGVQVVDHRTVINISSICALQPFKSWSIYCAGKAARDMLFRTMALESHNIRVLSYAPGPLDTDMQLEARTKTGDTELKDMFSSMHAQSKLLSCDQSVDKLIRLLDTNQFDSGSHIDYYDF